MSSGYIYVLSNPSFLSGIYKVGFTMRNPEGRMQELQQTSGVPTKFKLEYSEFVQDCVNVETNVHNLLEPYRVNPKREFFSAPLKLIIEEIRKISDNYRNFNEHHVQLESQLTEDSMVIEHLNETVLGICQFPCCYSKVNGKDGYGIVYCETHIKHFEEDPKRDF